MRLDTPGFSPLGPALTFRFDGEPVTALPGETVGAALAASGRLALRRTAAGAPRGLYCGMGACWDCAVTIDGRAGERACQVKAAPGLDVRSAPPGTPTPFGFDAAPPAEPEEHRPDLLVVGAGPAGLSTAIEAARAGAVVTVLDERDAAGGQYLKPLAAHAADRPDAQHRRGDALRAEARAAGVRLETGALVWGAFARDEVAALLRGRAALFRPHQLLLAPGAHERPVALPGWTLPGVMTTGALQTLARAGRVSPAPVVVVAGNGPLNLQLACELVEGGARVAAVVEAAPRPGPRAWRDALRMGLAAPDLAWDGTRYLLRLRRAGVPVLWGARVAACEGEGRLERVRVAAPGGERVLEAGALALHHGFVPETGLARALGAAHRAGPSGALETVTDEEGRTDVPGVAAIGDGAAAGGARAALAMGRIAGRAAARALGLDAPARAADRAALDRARAFQAALWRLFRAPPPAAPPDDVIACRCEEVTAGAVRAAGGTAVAARRATRAGMGACGGRFCASTLRDILGPAPGEAGFAAPRAPLRPVPAAAIWHPRPEAARERLYDAPALPRRWTTASPAPVPPDCDVLVVGGGVVGLSTALFLAREGRDVLVAERGEPGLGASTANAGSLHVQLLAYAFGDVGDPGPLAEALALAPPAVALWRELAAAAGETLSIRTEGGLILADTPDALDWLRRKTAFERARGIEAEVIGPAELRDLAPALRPGLAGASWCPAEGQMDPLRGTAALLRLARAAGARVAPGLEVLSLARDGAGYRVGVPGGAFRAGRIVNAAGPHAMAVAQMLGEALPMRLVVQQVIATSPGPPSLRPLVQWARRHLSLKQTDSGQLLIGGGWPGRLDEDGAARLIREAVEGNLWTAGQALPMLSGLRVLRAWASPNIHLDRGPLLGESARNPGLFHAITSNGWTLGPLVGRLVAEAILGRGGPPAAFAPGR
ncbi:FAD-dependent oxidoreductase [Roseomonas nepalensis]|uniref:FAD-dependent oxidoreductase n=1 Tax=Muricoccus nepalensis TaxID=1854500 RepID=A0A502GBS3_9PROT|nr:FAD-dependent oxidoreductase [Roseomonas nepalensis]TPG59717.1 FAD-dependent oxidoreductase [Roseomonas nepalensis]